jgi:hypothetical protein
MSVAADIRRIGREDDSLLSAAAHHVRRVIGVWEGDDCQPGEEYHPSTP